MKNIMGVILGAALVSACTQTTNLTVGPTNFGAVPQPEVTTLENFEGADAVSSWALSELPGRPWAEGTVSTGVGVNGSKGLSLDYKLVCENWGEKRCPDVLMLKKKLAAPLEAKALSFWLNSTTNMGIGVRVQDSAGQWFAYDDLGTQMANSGGFYRVTVPLERHTAHWGGSRDGVVRSPIQEVHVLVGGPGHNPFDGSTYAGRMVIDQIEAWKTLPTVATLEVRNAPLTKLPSSAAELKPRLGIVGYPDIWTANGAQIDANTLDSSKKLGVSFVRVDLGWANIEKNGQYDFSKYDRYLEAAQERGLNVLWILDYGHPDHSPFKTFPFTPTTDANFAAFGRYVEAAVTRYKGRNVRYEIFNEPDGYNYWKNDPNWTGPGDANTTHRPTAYAKLVRLSLEVVRRVDPNAIVSTGGLTAWKGVHGYLDAVLRTDAAAQANAAAFHFYTTNPERSFAQISRLRNQVTTKYPGRAIWDTEWGYGSDPPVNAQDRLALGDTARHAVYNLRRLLVTWVSDLGMTTLFHLQDGKADDTTAAESFGLLDANLKEKPAGTAIRVLSEIAATRKLIGTVQGLPIGVNAVQLESATDRVHVLWAETEGAVFEARVPCGATVKDLYNQGLTLSACSGSNGYQTLRLEEAKGPVYVFSNK
jgi:polysaccharide biosynthesis protein PslG